MSTMSHPVARNKIRFRVDMLARALGADSLAISGDGFTDTTENYTSFNHVRIEHSALLEVVRNGVLREQRCLQPDFGADPLAFDVRLGGRMLARTVRPELRAEGCTLNLIELFQVLPCLVATRDRY